jgi:hypothetical protein
MNDSAHYAYIQARLQARHGQRPDDTLWRRLQSVGDLASYIHIARKTKLRPWMLGLHATQGSHAIELSLRRQFRAYVDDISHWLPGSWGVTIRWVKRLPDLPALQQLLTTESVPVWILNDPALRAFGSENPTARAEAMLNSDCACLLRAWNRGQTLDEGWFEYWQSQWPDNTRHKAGLAYLGRMIKQHIQMLRSQSGRSSDPQRETLARHLLVAFRRYSFQPAVVYAHLALTALDLERLRGDLVRRALFPESTDAHS